MPAAPKQLQYGQKKLLLNLKSLFWCLHERQGQYNLNIVVHSLEQHYLHPDICDSHLGDNLRFLMDRFGREDLERIQEALTRVGRSRTAIDVGDKHFEIGHYVQAIHGFGPIAMDAYGIICSVTPQLRALFYLDGPQLLESAFAPSDVRVIFGTYIS